MDRVAIFPGSFDPFTRGHEAIVEQALTLFDRVVVAIGHNSEKRGFMDIESRIALIEELYSSEPRVEVCAYEGLTVDFARTKGAVAMIRGLRNTVDFEYEKSLAAINSRLCEQIATVVLFTPPQIADIASNVVRELYSYGHEIEDLMPQGVDFKKYIK